MASAIAGLHRKAQDICTDLRAHWYDRRLRIRTTGVRPGVDPQGYWYVPTPPAQVERILDHLQLNADDAFVDLGCGKGRVVCQAARRHIRLAAGVENSPKLADIARDNLRTLRGRRSPARIDTVGAERFEPDEFTAVFLFNPFGPDILQVVLDAVHASLLRAPRRFQLAYANPLHGEVCDRQPWLQRGESWPAQLRRHDDYAVTFWHAHAAATLPYTHAPADAPHSLRQHRAAGTIEAMPQARTHSSAHSDR